MRRSRRALLAFSFPTAYTRAGARRSLQVTKVDSDVSLPVFPSMFVSDGLIRLCEI